MWKQAKHLTNSPVIRPPPTISYNNSNPSKTHVFFCAVKTISRDFDGGNQVPLLGVSTFDSRFIDPANNC